MNVKSLGRLDTLIDAFFFSSFLSFALVFSLLTICECKH